MADVDPVNDRWPIVVAHRGASAAHPENTLQAFEAAVSEGADVVELDVRLTADGIPVVLHDGDVSITTDGRGLVHGMTLAEVKRLDASGGRSARAEVPTLREALDTLSGRAGVDVEVKNIPGDASFDSPRETLAERTLDIIHDIGFRGILLVSSFNWLSIERVRILDPAIATGVLAPGALDPRSALQYSGAKGHAYVLPPFDSVLEAGEAFVREAHGLGVRVGTWTVDDPATIERLFAMGVDAVASNRPDVAVPIRDRFRSEHH